MTILLRVVRYITIVSLLYGGMFYLVGLYLYPMPFYVTYSLGLVVAISLVICAVLETSIKENK